MIFGEEQQRRLGELGAASDLAGLRTAQTVPSSAGVTARLERTNASTLCGTQAVYSGTGGTPFRRSAPAGFLVHTRHPVPRTPRKNGRI
ncbi:MAG: hypothetical protein ACLRWP_12500 [Bilophila wadsworthia]